MPGTLTEILQHEIEAFTGRRIFVNIIILLVIRMIFGGPFFWAREGRGGGGACA